MKIWHQYGSEHSANLVMIGKFKSVSEATKAKEIIDNLTRQVNEDVDKGTIVVGSPRERYGEEMLDLMWKLNVHSIGPGELEQFAYDFNVDVENDSVIVTTEEIDISAFLKVLFDQGACIQVYSAHHYPDTDHGRGK